MPAFIPAPLPPADPPLEIDLPMKRRLRAAEEAIARLEIAREMWTPESGLAHAFTRHEALRSCQLAGCDETSSEVEGYVGALTFARKELRSAAAPPLSMRLLDRAHRQLLGDAPGAGARPGEIRRRPSSIGGGVGRTILHVPPPPGALPETLGALDEYLRKDDGLPPLVRVALAHAQLGLIHPYEDGNGRIGRIFVTLLLERARLLGAPVLPFSDYLRRGSLEYSHRLRAVAQDGEWEAWTGWFVDGVAAVAEATFACARDLLGLASADRQRVLRREGSSVLSIRLFETLLERPVVTVKDAMDRIDATFPTAAKAIESLVAARVLAETTGRKRERAWEYRKYAERLERGAVP